MGKTAEQLKAELAANIDKPLESTENAESLNSHESAQPKPVSTRKDRGIKGTLVDDIIAEYALITVAIFGFLVIGGGLWLWFERIVGVDKIRHFRIWIPTAFMVIQMYRVRPFFKYGLFGWFFILVQTINLSGYLFQMMQSLTGVR